MNYPHRKILKDRDRRKDGEAEAGSQGSHRKFGLGFHGRLSLLEIE